MHDDDGYKKEEYTQINRKDLNEIIFQLRAWKRECGELRIENDHLKRLVENQRVNAVNEILARIPSDVLD